MAGRSRLETEEGLLERFAVLYADGATREAIGEEINCSVDSVTRWSRDERVQKLVARLLRERESRMLRKIDAGLEAAVNNPDAQKDPRLLMELRKTIAPATQKFEDRTRRPDQAASELWRKFTENPDMTLAEFLGDELAGATAGGGDESD